MSNSELNLEKTFRLLIQIPLYKSRQKEEVFLGIKKSKYPKWIGWQFIKEMKKNGSFLHNLPNSGLYDLAINFWILQSKNKEITLELLENEYEF